MDIVLIDDTLYPTIKILGEYSTEEKKLKSFYDAVKFFEWLDDDGRIYITLNGFDRLFRYLKNDYSQLVVLNHIHSTGNMVQPSCNRVLDCLHFYKTIGLPWIVPEKIEDDWQTHEAFIILITLVRQFGKLPCDYRLLSCQPDAYLGDPHESGKKLSVIVFDTHIKRWSNVYMYSLLPIYIDTTEGVISVVSRILISMNHINNNHAIYIGYLAILKLCAIYPDISFRVNASVGSIVAKGGILTVQNGFILSTRPIDELKYVQSLKNIIIERVDPIVLLGETTNGKIWTHGLDESHHNIVCDEFIRKKLAAECLQYNAFFESYPDFNIRLQGGRKHRLPYRLDLYHHVSVAESNKFKFKPHPMTFGSYLLKCLHDPYIDYINLYLKHIAQVNEWDFQTFTKSFGSWDIPNIIDGNEALPFIDSHTYVDGCLIKYFNQLVLFDMKTGNTKHPDIYDNLALVYDHESYINMLANMMICGYVRSGPGNILKYTPPPNIPKITHLIGKGFIFMRIQYKNSSSNPSWLFHNSISGFIEYIDQIQDIK